MRELCAYYRWNAEDIACHWVAFYVSKKMDMKPTVKLLEQMEKEVKFIFETIIKCNYGYLFYFLNCNAIFFFLLMLCNTLKSFIHEFYNYI